MTQQMQKNTKNIRAIQVGDIIVETQFLKKEQPLTFLFNTIKYKELVFISKPI